MRSRIPLTALVGALLLVAPTSPLEAQETPGLAGGNLLAWLGLETGDTLAFVNGRGDEVCARVGKERRLDGRSWVTLQGLPWPGLATDSQILLPLDGSLGVGVIRTPGPRPRVDDLLETAALETVADSMPYLPDLAPVLMGETIPADGWYAVGGKPGKPEALFYVWCSACMDARTIVLLERGRGIGLVESTTIAGVERLMRAEGCRCTWSRRRPGTREAAR